MHCMARRGADSVHTVVDAYTFAIHRAFVLGAGLAGVSTLAPKPLDIFWFAAQTKPAIHRAIYASMQTAASAMSPDRMTPLTLLMQVGQRHLWIAECVAGSLLPGVWPC
jgi:hypothetical protein